MLVQTTFIAVVFVRPVPTAVPDAPTRVVYSGWHHRNAVSVALYQLLRDTSMYFDEPVPLVYTTIPPPGPVSPTTQVPPSAQVAGATVVVVVDDVEDVEEVVVVVGVGSSVAPVKLAPVNVAPVKFAPVKVALVKLALVKFALVKFALVRFAPLKFAELAFAPLRFAPVIAAPSNPTAPDRFVFRKSTFVMVALENMAPVKIVPVLNSVPTSDALSKFAPARSDWRKSAPSSTEPMIVEPDNIVKSADGRRAP